MHALPVEGDHQIVGTGVGVVELRAAERPRPAPGELLIETVCSAISPGTELAFLDGAPGTPRVYPFHPGYSAVGRVAGRADGADGPPDGTLVAFSGLHRAWQCCAADRVHPLPREADATAWSPFLIAGISLHGVRRGGVRLGDTVTVLGLGPIGLFAAQLARAAGATAIIAVDPLAARCDLALRLGCTEAAADAETARRGARVVIEATGRPAGVRDALELVAAEGTVVLLGSTRGAVDGIDAYASIHRPNITVIGAHAYCGRPERPGAFRIRPSMHEDEACVCALLEQGRLDTASLISRRWRPQEAAAAYAAARSDPAGTIIPVFDWRR